MTPDPPVKTSHSNDKRTHYDFDSQMKQIVAGATSSALTRFLTQPFEVLKIRFQLQVEPLKGGPGQTASKYTSFIQACRLILKEEGITAFWKGHNAGQLLSIVYGTAQFWAYEQIRLGLSQTEALRNRENLNRFLSGGASGCVATLISMPFDVIRTRLVSQDVGGGYRNATAAVPHILRAEGVRGLYRGLGTALIQMYPLVGANFAIYGLFNDVACTFWNATDYNQLPTVVLLLSGGAAGTISKMAVYPLDFIKRRLQMQGFHDHRKTYGKNQKCDGILSCVKITLREEGAFGFYKGMAPTLIKSGMSSALYFGFYEKVKGLWFGRS